MLLKTEYDKPVEIADGIYWVGYNTESIFRCNPYLIVDGDEAVLIDPGSSVDFFAVRSKVASIISLDKIKHIILHHQDPDLCGSARQFEVLIGKDRLKVYNPLRSSFFTRFYGIETPITNISEDDQSITLASGRKIKFLMTPYCHSPGAMITFDEKTKFLFTSDIFGAFNEEWDLFADKVSREKHEESVRLFMEPFMGSDDAMQQAISKMENLEVNSICPQHGSIIRKDMKGWLKKAKEFKYGGYLRKNMKDEYMHVAWAMGIDIK